MIAVKSVKIYEKPPFSFWGCKCTHNLGKNENYYWDWGKSLPQLPKSITTYIGSI